jgi:hypothetical protein
VWSYRNGPHIRKSVIQPSSCFVISHRLRGKIHPLVKEMVVVRGMGEGRIHIVMLAPGAHDITYLICHEMILYDADDAG